jgi:FtsZ-binding cell division protein ZapB
LRIPDRLTDVVSWHGHIPFAFALVDSFHPRVIVELGVHKGDSYCAFCEAVSALRMDTKCYAVDTWEGDPQAGYYGEEVYQDLKSYHDPRYGAFSKMVRERFSAAVQSFEDGVIDLLHIDGMHTYDAVSYDFATWVPKLSHRSIVLLHDIGVREGDFGVWRLWEQLANRYPSFEFHHSSGLGVLGVGPDAVKEVGWLFQAETSESIRLKELFERLGQAVAVTDKGRDKVEAELRQALEAREAEVSAARNNIDALVAEIGQARNNIDALVAEIGQARDSNNLLAGQIEEARAAHAARDKIEADLKQALEAREAEVSAARNNIDALVAEIGQARDSNNLLVGQIEEAKAAHAARDKIEADLRQALEAREAEVEDLIRTSRQLKIRLDSIFGSFSYKISHPLHWIRMRHNSRKTE